jgi:hypothetical protein
MNKLHSHDIRFCRCLYFFCLCVYPTAMGVGTCRMFMYILPTLFYLEIGRHCLSSIPIFLLFSSLFFSLCCFLSTIGPWLFCHRIPFIMSAAYTSDDEDTVSVDLRDDIFIGDSASDAESTAPVVARCVHCHPPSSSFFSPYTAVRTTTSDS